MVIIEYSWEGGTHFLNDEQKKAFRASLKALRALGFKRSQWSSTVEYTADDSVASKAVEIREIVSRMTSIMKTADRIRWERWNQMGKQNFASLYGGVYISCATIRGLERAGVYEACNAILSLSEVKEGRTQKGTSTSARVYVYVHKLDAELEERIDGIINAHQVMRTGREITPYTDEILEIQMVIEKRAIV